MTYLDILILLLIGLLVFRAWRWSKRHGGCSGDCSACSDHCPTRAEADEG